MDGTIKAILYAAGFCIACVHGVPMPDPIPDQGFFMISHYPETGRSSPLHIYAIENLGRDGEFSIAKEGGLPSDGIQTGLIRTENGMTFGCFLQVHERNRLGGVRYGQYTGSFALNKGGNQLSGYTFVKPKSDILNTRGVQTVTIYPSSTTSNDLDAPVSIGVAHRPGCRAIKWCKGKKRNINSGPRLILKHTDDAGLYTIKRSGKRAKRGWFVQILVIAATCPEGSYSSGPGCASTKLLCLNGGVLSDHYESCICPPFMVGTQCECAASLDGSELLLGDQLLCEDLPDGNPKCKGYLVCYGDNYGCTCASGWQGNACDRACPKGRWGANCEQHCPDSESDCNRFYGPSSNLFKNGCVSQQLTPVED